LAFLTALFFIFAHQRPATAHPFDENYKSAINVLESYKNMADENPEDVELQYLYADMLVMSNKLDDAEKVILKRVLAQDPKYDMAYYLLSEVYYRQKRFAKSLEPLKKIRAKDMKDDVLIAEATIYLKLKKPKMCMAKAREAMKVDKTNPGGHLHVGLAYLDLGDAANGMKHMELSLLMDPTQPLVYDWLKREYEEHLTLEQQQKRLESLLARSPKNPEFEARLRRDISEIQERLKK